MKVVGCLLFCKVLVCLVLMMFWVVLVVGVFFSVCVYLCVQDVIGDWFVVFNVGSFEGLQVFVDRYVKK